MAGKTGMESYSLIRPFTEVMFLVVCNPQTNALTSGGTWCYGYGVTPSQTLKNGVPSNWPPVYQTGRVAQFNYQTGLAVNTYGSMLFVADTGQNIIRLLYCASGAFIFQ